MKYKKTAFLSLILGLFFVNLLYAGEYKRIDPREIQVDKSSLNGQKVTFEDVFLGCSSTENHYLPRFKNYIAVNTKKAGTCYLEKKDKDMIMDIENGNTIIVYGKIEGWNPGHGIRYDFFANNIKKVSSAEKSDSDRKSHKAKIRFNFGGKEYEMAEGKIYKLKCPDSGRDIEVSFTIQENP